MPKVLVTGASGLLGREILNEFKRNDWEVLGLAYSRAKGDLVKVDLNDYDSVYKIIESFKPQVIIHSAAERSPDKVDKQYEACLKLNVDSSRKLAEFSESIQAAFLYISTDYVFNGNNPPYKEDADPSPINGYGVTKYEGEKAVQEVNKDSCILRIPVLYGDEEYVGESAISSLLKTLFSKNPAKVSNYEVRYPSCTNDIAVVCCQLMTMKLKKEEISGIFHWCGFEPLTKYEMTKIMAQVFSLPSDHIVSDNDPSPGTPRPKNTQLSCDRLKLLKIGQHTKFNEGIDKYFNKFTPQ